MYETLLNESNTSRRNNITQPQYWVTADRENDYVLISAWLLFIFDDA